MKTNANHEAALRAARLVNEAGGRAFFVGGCVRDALLGAEPDDFDIEAYGIAPEALSAALARAFRIDAVGGSFCVCKLSGFGVDVSLPRRESKTGAGHRGFKVGAAPDLPFAEAAARRDFTVNAIMRDPFGGEIIDPFGGAEDLRRGVLRHVGPKFAEDPLRVLRAMQFAARLRFAVAPETVALCSAMSQDGLPRERIAAEWEKLLLKGARPSLGLAFLRDCGWLRFYPELIPLIGCAQDPEWHPEGDVWTHTLCALDALPLVRQDAGADGGAEGEKAAGKSDALLVALSVLCHDFGKPLTSARTAEGRVTAHGHECAADALIRSFIERLWNLRGLPDQVARLVRAHMRPLALVLQKSGDKAYRRLAADAGRLDLLAKITECDTRGTPPNPPNVEMVREFLRRAAALRVLSSAPEPLVKGRHLIALGMEPGPDFKPALDALYGKQLDGDFTDAPSALAAARDFLHGSGDAGVTSPAPR